MGNLLLRSAFLRDLEAAHAKEALMAKAGAAAAVWAADLAVDAGLPILILAGPGNNGGDAFVAARHLRERSFDVHLVFVGDPDGQSQDAASARVEFVAAGGVCKTEIPELLRWGLVVDGLFGIGLSRAPEGVYADWIRYVNGLAERDGCPILALDC
ncbi:MAG: NAD(P)H-hydrate epimerase, partial [Betaproteobacteria bacterium]|nr:NAD(P)H-hydrate epimerase [Betaproteobacteria bacterium]